MKKIVLVLVAIFTMGAMAVAQNDIQINNIESSSVEQFLADNSEDFQMVEDIDLSQIQDLSFADENAMFEGVATLSQKGNSNVVGAILAIFLGDFGIHHFYTGDTKHGILHLVFCWTAVPGIIGVIEGIIWLVDESSFPKSLIEML